MYTSRPYTASAAAPVVGYAGGLDAQKLDAKWGLYPPIWKLLHDKKWGPIPLSPRFRRLCVRLLIVGHKVAVV